MITFSVFFLKFDNSAESFVCSQVKNNLPILTRTVFVMVSAHSDFFVFLISVLQIFLMYECMYVLLLI